MTAVAKGMVFAPTEGRAEVWPVAAEVEKYTAILGTGDRPGIALAASGGKTTTVAIGTSGVSVTFPSAPQGYDPLEVGVWLDGTYEFDAIAGVDANTVQGSTVYIEPDGDLTLTQSTNKKYGSINYPKGYVKSALKAPVKVGG